MKIGINIIKGIISAFSFFIKKSSDSKTYLFSVALRKDVDNYIENGYYLGYKHIEKSIEIAGKFSGKTGEFIIADVGGSTGTTAILYSKAFPKAPVYVFEPIQESFSALKERLKNERNAFPINKALGNEVGKASINVASRISSSSIFNLYTDPSAPVFTEALAHERTETIQISTLDTEIPEDKQVLILKIDVQGYELEVLKGGAETLKRTQVITLEMNNHNGYTGSPKYFELDNFLRNTGFCLYELLPSTHTNGRLVEWDCIYVNQNLL
jgi:FkbM family methyltransferase